MAYASLLLPGLLRTRRGTHPLHAETDIEVILYGRLYLIVESSLYEVSSTERLSVAFSLGHNPSALAC